MPAKKLSVAQAREEIRIKVGAAQRRRLRGRRRKPDLTPLKEGVYLENQNLAQISSMEVADIILGGMAKQQGIFKHYEKMNVNIWVDDPINEYNINPVNWNVPTAVILLGQIMTNEALMEKWFKKAYTVVMQNPKIGLSARWIEWMAPDGLYKGPKRAGKPDKRAALRRDRTRELSVGGSTDLEKMERGSNRVAGAKSPRRGTFLPNFPMDHSFTKGVAAIAKRFGIVKKYGKMNYGTPTVSEFLRISVNRPSPYRSVFLLAEWGTGQYAPSVAKRNFESFGTTFYKVHPKLKQTGYYRDTSWWFPRRTTALMQETFVLGLQDSRAKASNARKQGVFGWHIFATGIGPSLVTAGAQGIHKFNVGEPGKEAAELRLLREAIIAQFLSYVEEAINQKLRNLGYPEVPIGWLSPSGASGVTRKAAGIIGLPDTKDLFTVQLIRDAKRTK